MNRQALEHVIRRHLHHIEKYCDQIPGSFTVEDIHELRVEYKKSRAFLRLLQHERDAGKLQMPEPLKAVYKTAGEVRDIQLFLLLISGLPIAGALPVFLSAWQKQLFSCKEALVKAIEEANFKKITASIKKELPDQLQDDTIQQFMHEKIAAIRIILLAAEEENDLHDIRKNLKDIIYNIRLFENDLQIPFPVQTFASEKELSDMASRLGDFNDRCIALDMLQAHAGDNLPPSEQKLLNELQTSWQQQKDSAQQQLLQQVQQWQIVHS
jgi:CHAD domain-containing protein